jgi:short-subunit dehydrogenase
MSHKARLLFPESPLYQRKVSQCLNKKTILITGATFGIGEALARYLLHYDVKLILIGRTTEKLMALRDESIALAAQVTTFSCDFYNEESVSDLCRHLQPIHIDYFVSNAGKSMMRSLEESMDRFHDFKRTIAVNYLAPVQIICALAKNFKEAQTHIVNVTTYSVLMKTPPNWSAYISSKKAMHSWFESNLPELELQNIRVSNIYFPLVESRMKNANPSYKDTPAMSMDTAVAIILKTLYKPKYNFRPWWHAPLQVLLFVGSPWWVPFWKRRIRQRNY